MYDAAFATLKEESPPSRTYVLLESDASLICTAKTAQMAAKMVNRRSSDEMYMLELRVHEGTYAFVYGNLAKY